MGPSLLSQHTVTAGNSSGIRAAQPDEGACPGYKSGVSQGWRSNPALSHPISRFLSTWKPAEVCIHRENELKKEGPVQKRPCLVLITFSLGLFIEYSVDLRGVVTLGWDNSKLPSNCHRSSSCSPHRCVSTKPHPLNPDLWPQRKWSCLQFTEHKAALLFLECVVMNTVMLIIKVMGTIKVYLQRYKQKSSSVSAPILKVQLRAGLKEWGLERTLGAWVGTDPTLKFPEPESC